MNKKYRLIKKKIAIFALTAVVGISSLGCNSKNTKDNLAKPLPVEPDKSNSEEIKDNVTHFEDEFEFQNNFSVGGGYSLNRSIFKYQ